MFISMVVVVSFSRRFPELWASLFHFLSLSLSFSLGEESFLL